jgi:hypothetical protein
MEELELGKLERGTPKDWVLYEFQSQGAEPGYMHVDSDGVYWTEKGGELIAGSKDGKKTPEEIGVFTSTLLGITVDSDNTHVYWLDGKRLRRRAKTGGETESIELMWSHEGGDLAFDDQYIYVALWGCPAITRIDKKSLESETMYIEVEGIGSGPTTLVVDRGEFFCASWGNIFSIPGWNEPAKLLVALEDPTTEWTDDRIWGMVVAGNDIYWVARPSGSRPIYIGKVARTGGDKETFPTRFGNGTSELVCCPAQRRIYFSEGFSLVYFSITDKNYGFMLSDWPTGGIAIDEQYLYWTNYIPGSVELGSIKRMPLDHPPMYIFE